MKNYEEYQLVDEDFEFEEEPEPYNPYHLNHDDPIEEHIEEFIGD